MRCRSSSSICVIFFSIKSNNENGIVQTYLEITTIIMESIHCSINFTRNEALIVKWTRICKKFFYEWAHCKRRKSEGNTRALRKRSKMVECFSKLKGVETSMTFWHHCWRSELGFFENNSIYSMWKLHWGFCQVFLCHFGRVCTL